MDDEDEIIDLGDETEQVLAQMKKSLKGEQETELAFQIADRFISIQEVDGGYDYSIMGADYKEIDGGVYDNKSNGVGYDVSIREALDDILTDLRENPFDNGTRGNIRDNDEWIPIDYDGLNRPRPHRHLKRKDSILFLIFLGFSYFFTRSGWQKKLFCLCKACAVFI